MIRKLIYTTNAAENFHRQLRKVTKTKGAFVSEGALMKMLYLSTMRVSEKWTQLGLNPDSGLYTKYYALPLLKIISRPSEGCIAPFAFFSGLSPISRDTTPLLGARAVPS